MRRVFQQILQSVVMLDNVESFSPLLGITNSLYKQTNKQLAHIVNNNNLNINSVILVARMMFMPIVQYCQTNITLIVFITVSH